MTAASDVRRFRWRRRVLLGGWLLACLVIVAKAGSVQILHGAYWSGEALKQHEAAHPVPARRGAILDWRQNPLSTSTESYEVAVAPHELVELQREETIATLTKELDLSRSRVRAISEPGRRWVELGRGFPPRVRESLEGIQGVYLKAGWTRHLPYGDLASDVLGTIQDESGRGGVEGRYEDHLRGTAGEEVQARDVDQNPIPGQSILVRAPEAGGDVILTLDRDLQTFGEEALREAIEKTGAKGGNLLVADPTTGDIRAMVSLVGDEVGNLSSINAPYEPGSTLKPFTVAAILGHGVATLADSVDGEDGYWQAGRKSLRDVHAMGMMTLEDALRESSNIGIAKIAEGLTHGQQYEMLRDFGFGSRTGIELGPESSGRLPRPSVWSLTSPSRLAIGYEVSVTPIQMVMAYGALANGGKLMQPRLVKELRGSDGETIYRSEPRVVRQVIPGSLARELAEVLITVVDDGTGTEAQLAGFDMAGKSGTSRAYGSTGYEDGHYASFVCFLPVPDPQFVVFVKLDRPKGAYYGGATAAPVIRAMLEAVLAARQAPIDWGAMASHDRRQPSKHPLPGAQFASSTPTPNPPVRTPRTTPHPETGAVVPDVSGLSTRLAVRRLHSHGFRVLLDAQGVVVGTDPPANTPLTPGDTVRIRVRKVEDG